MVARRRTDRLGPRRTVSEAFAKVLDTLRAGRSPSSAFRAYLLTALRNVPTTSPGGLRAQVKYGAHDRDETGPENDWVAGGQGDDQ